MLFEMQPGASASVWVGRALSGLTVAFLLMDAGMKLLAIQPVIDASRELGFPPTASMARGLGILLLLCTVLYAVPKTALIGAVLLTGYLGGAIAVQLRVGNPLFTHVLFGAYVGVAMWAGLLARSAPVRAVLLPAA